MKRFAFVLPLLLLITTGSQPVDSRVDSAMPRHQVRGTAGDVQDPQLPELLKRYREQQALLHCAQVMWAYDTPVDGGRLAWHDGLRYEETMPLSDARSAVYRTLFGQLIEAGIAGIQRDLRISNGNEWLVQLGTLYGDAIPVKVLQVVEQYLAPVGSDPGLNDAAAAWVRNDLKRQPTPFENELLTVRYLRHFDPASYPRGVPIRALLDLEVDKARTINKQQ